MVHSHHHDEWSALDGCGSALLHAEVASSLGMPALGQTNHGTLSGALHHIQACYNEPVKGKRPREGDPIMPICGIEAYFKPDRSDEEIKNPWHICLYAKNLKGWHSLLRLSTEAYESGYVAGKASVDLDLMRKHSEGVVCSTACLKSYLSHHILQGNEDEADKFFQELLAIYRSDLFGEIMPHSVGEQSILNLAIINMCHNYGVPVITTCDVHYPTKDWFDTYRVAGFMNTRMSFETLKKKKEEGKNVLEFDLPTLYLMTEGEIHEAYNDNHPNIPDSVIEESLKNTHIFANRFSPFFLDRSQKLPNVKKKVKDPRETVLAWAREGMQRIGREGDSEYEERYEFEKAELDKQDVYDYFYIVGEAVRWAKANKIRVGLGRGSAAGCLISYLVGITNIDPIAYGLLFERFLNPNRKGMPDIDIDFSSEGRQKVKDHLAAEWGQDHVADIIAHQTFKPKAALRKVSSVYDVPFEEVLEVTKTIDIRPDDEETTLEQIRPINSVLDKYANKYPDIWQHALRLEGSPAVASKHAAGLIVTDKPCKEFIPLERSKDGGFVTSFNDSAEFPIVTEYLNVMKLDFLGIKGLDRQEYAVELIEERTGKEVDLDNLPILGDPDATDPEVMEIFSSGKTLGIWQFSGSGITSLLRQMKPDSVRDLIAANALYRPGPMEYAFEYGERKRMPAEEIDYWHPIFKPYLEETYGIVAFQEQVMIIAQEVGNLSPGDADDMRKAMGKLYRLPGKQAQQFMQGFKQKWDEGFAEKGLDDKLRDLIWQHFLSFGNYAFNKSHSAAYAVQAYIDGYLKWIDPLSAYASLLTHSDDKEIRPSIIREARLFDVKISPPDINESNFGFTPSGDKILYGLTAVDAVGDVAIQNIIKERPFKDMRDFEERMRTKGSVKVNKKVLDNLIKCGAFDRFGLRDEYSEREKARLEKEILGVPISGAAAMEKYQDKINDYTMPRDEYDRLPDNSNVQIAGEIVSIKHTSTKRENKPMAIISLANGADEYRCTLFPEVYKSQKDSLQSTAVIVAGKKNIWNGQDGIIVSHVADLQEFIKEIDE